MRRWWVILLCVLIGAGIHVAAAYAAWPPSGGMPIVGSRSAESWPLVALPEEFPAAAEEVVEFRRRWASRDMWQALAGTKVYLVERVSWGVPIRSLARMERNVLDLNGTPARSELWLGPTQVLWSGMLLNTATYTGMVWGVLWVAATVYWARRVAPGCCARCRYDLTGLAVEAACPECGVAQAGGAAT